MDKSYIAIIRHSENQFSGIEHRHHPTREIAIEKLIESIHKYLMAIEEERYMLAHGALMTANDSVIPDRLKVLPEWNERRQQQKKYI